MSISWASGGQTGSCKVQLSGTLERFACFRLGLFPTSSTLQALRTFAASCKPPNTRCSSSSGGCYAGKNLSRKEPTPRPDLPASFRLIPALEKTHPTCPIATRVQTSNPRPHFPGCCTRKEAYRKLEPFRLDKLDAAKGT